MKTVVYVSFILDILKHDFHFGQSKNYYFLILILILNSAIIFAILMADFVAVMVGWAVGLVLRTMKVVGDLQGILMECMSQKHPQWVTKEVLENTQAHMYLYKYFFFFCSHMSLNTLLFLCLKIKYGRCFMDSVLTDEISRRDREGAYTRYGRDYMSRDYEPSRSDVWLYCALKIYYFFSSTSR